MKTARFLVVLLTMLSFSAVAVAQGAVENEEFGVSIPAPADWEVVSDDDKAVASFKHAASQSQIQVIGTKLMNEEVADVFFETFHSTLEESNFEVVERGEQTYGDLTGNAVTYKFTHSGVTLQVKVFEFLRDQTAWLAIGYMQDEESENYTQAYTSVIEQIRFSDDG